MPIAPSVRQSTINFDLQLKGNYFDELDGVKNDEFIWKADGFKFTDRTGTGAGQSNRFWYKRNLVIPYSEYADLDLCSFSTIDGGKGLGQDQLGLPISMSQVTFLLIRNKLNGSNLVMGDHPDAPWTSLLTGTLSLPPGNFLIFQTRAVPGWESAVGTNQFLRLTPDGTDCTVDIYVAGRDLS